jgi:hypothetical protein
MDTREPASALVGLAYCPILAYENRDRGVSSAQTTCDTVDCDRCGPIMELIGEFSSGHCWVCWQCAEVVDGTLLGFYIDGFCDHCGGRNKAEELGESRPVPSLLQLLDQTGTIEKEVRRRHEVSTDDP